jgi:hypothetical protein
MSNPHEPRDTIHAEPPEDDFPTRETKPPEADAREPADLLASVAFQLDGVSQQLASVARDLAFAIGQGQSQSRTLGEHDQRLTRLESAVHELKQEVASLIDDGK